MHTKPRANPAESSRTLCSMIASQVDTRTSRAEPLFSNCFRALPVLAGLLSMMAAAHVDAAASDSSPPTSTQIDGARGEITNPDSVLAFPPIASIDFAPANVLVGGHSEMTITLGNPNLSGDIVGVQISDIYPAGMANMSGNPVLDDTCNFNEAVPAGGSLANLVNGTVPAGSSCSIVIEVVGTAPPNVADNHTGIISSGNAPDGADASAILTVGLSAPIVEKSFDPNGIYVGGTSRMTIKLSNPNATDDIVGARFTDDYPTTPLSIVNAASGDIVSNTCGGTLDALPQDAKVVLTGGTIPANDSCSVVINIVGTATAFTTNHTGPVDSDNAFSGADATGVIVVNNVPLLNAPAAYMLFTPATVSPQGGSMLTIGFENTNVDPILGAQLDDMYPTGMINASGNPIVSDTCNFNHDVPAGGNWMKLSGGTIPVAGCEIHINVVADVMTSIVLTNTTSAVISGNAQTSAGATGDLTVDTGAPTVTCMLPTQVDIVGDMVAIDLASLFMPPLGQSLIYETDNAPPGLVMAGSMLTGTLATAGMFTSTLKATTTPGGMTASEDVTFDILTLDELVFRNGFGDPSTPCQ